VDTLPYRPATETSLAWISIVFAVLNFGMLTIDFVRTSNAIPAYMWAFFMNGVLVFVGYFSLRCRPKSCAQQLAGAWFFAPVVVFSANPAEDLIAMVSLHKMTPIFFSIFMLIWAITLAVKQSRRERVR
jgi:peptidoglycan/LPS O-acetylase OafA/YrhL